MTIWAYIAFSLSALVLVLAYWKKALSLSATILAILMVYVATTAGINYVVFHVLAFLMISVIDHICRKKSQFTNDNIVQKTGTRDHIQVFVNGGIAMISVLLWHIYKNKVFLLCFTASLIESFGDSAASDFGIAFGKQAYDICRFRKIQAGLSGGITLAGTTGCFLSCLLMSAVAYFFHLAGTLKETMLLAVAGFLGCMIDSVLGSTVQRKEQCQSCGIITEKKHHCNMPTKYYSGIRWINNDVVNLMCNLISALLIMILVKIGW